MSSLMMRRVYKRRPTTPPADPAFKLTVDTTKAGSASDTFVLPLPSGFTYDCVVDWGDGTEAITTSGNKSHTWATGGIKQISITGTLPTIKFLDTGDKLKAISIDNWGTMPWLSLRESFRGCANLNSVAEGGNFLGVTDGFAAWFGCSSLAAFPALAFPAANSLSYAWRGCTGLTAFPLITFGGTSNTSFDYAWYGCTGLTAFPMLDLSMFSGITLYATWYGCNGLLTFPTLALGNVTVLNQTWQGCSKITTSPETFLSNLTDGKIASVANACNGCVAMVGNSYPFWDWTTEPTTKTDAYNLCAALTDYATIPAAYK